MSEQQPPKDILQPIYPIPIIATSQPLTQTANKLNYFNPRDQIEIYKRQYAKLLKQNGLLLSQLTKVTLQKQELQAKYNNLQTAPSDSKHEKESLQDKKKRVRRTADQIPRDFDCHIERCGKSYGTQASLIQHVKLKHPQACLTKQYEEHLANLRKRNEAKASKVDSNSLNASASNPNEVEQDK